MQFIIEIKTLIQSARTKAYQAINSAMIEAYWEIGKRIVEEEQNGNQRASYGQEIIKKLSIVNNIDLILKMMVNMLKKQKQCITLLKIDMMKL